ncbi:MAG: hypothetical protein AB7L84_16900 [Acidimicrobiia bacterium]
MADGLRDDGERLAWLRQAYYGVDGRWYLKVRDRWGPEAAQEVDEAAMASLGRLHLRAWLELTGRQHVDDCRVLGRFVLDVLDTLYGSAADAVRVVRDEPDVWEMAHVRCTIFDMGAAAGFTPVPGALPGCGGILALYGGWVAAAGPAFSVDQVPAPGGDHGVACRYAFRLNPGPARPPRG